MMDDADQEIRALLAECRRKLAAWQRAHKSFHPALFDGPPASARADLLTGCQVVENRIEIVRRLPKGGRFAEVGTLYGDFIVQVIDILQPDAVDLFDVSFHNVRPQHAEKMDRHGAVTRHLGDSSTRLSELPDAVFDAVYVDGDHSYAGVNKDLCQALRVLKPDGYLVCNDYTNWDPIQLMPYGVYAAVNRFANENDLAFAFIGLAPLGFHDVALRRRHARKIA